MRILFWNIQHGGGQRVSRIIDALLHHNADVNILIEFRTGPGQAIRKALQSSGWAHEVCTDPAGSDNGIYVCSRVPVVRLSEGTPPAENAVRWLEVSFSNYDISLLCVHILTEVPGSIHRPAVSKTMFWDAVLDYAEGHLNSPCMIVGDFNTGEHYRDEVGKTFVCADRFCRLGMIGWKDAWRHMHGSIFQPTWYSRARGGGHGNPFRLDHMFVTPAMLPFVTSCEYFHGERESGISDHSIMSLELRFPER